MTRHVFFILLSYCLIVLQSFSQKTPTIYLTLDRIILPAYFKIEIYADSVFNARALDFAEDGTLFAGSKEEGKVYAIRPDRSVIVIGQGLKMPTGLDYYKGDLYVSEVTQVIKYEKILEHLDKPPKPVIIFKSLPGNDINGCKFIRVGPDEKIYVPVPSPCNACFSPDKSFATILRINLDGSVPEIFALGVRNTLGFDWDPETGVLWFTEISSDGLNDNSPPDELNKALVHSMHFGFPYLHARIQDPKFWKQRPVNAMFANPAMELNAYSAPQGMRFSYGTAFGERFTGGIFIAEHGAGQVMQRTGCRISFIKIVEGRAAGYEVFASGWLTGERAWGRPADVQVGPDGALYVSDDLAGVIYRIYYEKK